MKIKRHGAAFGVVAAGALLLTACGSDNNNATPGGTSAQPTSNIQCANGSLISAGSTAQSNAMSEWVKAYQNQCSGANINYQGGGSGKGVQQFQQGQTDFSGSDFPLGESDKPAADARCKSGPALDLPMVPGPIAVGYNVPGVDKPLNLSSSVLAKIFSGKITNWNDPAIAKDNPGVNFPSLGIQTFHRSDGSGTSYNFSNYLANEAKADFPFPANKNWPAPGGQGSNGTQGIAQGVKSTQGGIGYMELSFATQSSIPYAKVSNAAGQFVELTNDNVKNFLSKAKVVGEGNDVKLQFDYSNTDANAYPNLLVTYEIVCSSGNDPQKLPLLKGFLNYLASNDGQAPLAQQGYVPLPSNIQSKVQAAISSLK
ncbi:phosphate ABC transporter substrate-binding protein PstS [Amycolatopsis alkalitolerans]|uniref:Phosphate-binding protein n=1 Tax=Amycolatopsis alkalitolerans TaxID=2547244 RepID=A0A5C4M250_9PSEU|nr:phosphate ABC transporter substrate-binding protein PstS [Amycolatopsis alkalitolerans]TNC26142.1 phosphate ABC transporter substrate-binding protein PstS [Amycolatopsis alkalitolerans]